MTPSRSAAPGLKTATENGVLNSWKSIADLLHTSVRTAQRWEAHDGLPVHRPADSQKGPVLAFRTEIQRWLRARGPEPAALNGRQRPAPQRPSRSRRDDIRRQIGAVSENAGRALELVAEINRKMSELKATLDKSEANRRKLRHNGS